MSSWWLRSEYCTTSSVYTSNHVASEILLIRSFNRVAVHWPTDCLGMKWSHVDHFIFALTKWMVACGTQHDLPPRALIGYSSEERVWRFDDWITIRARRLIIRNHIPYPGFRPVNRKMIQAPRPVNLPNKRCALGIFSCTTLYEKPQRKGLSENDSYSSEKVSSCPVAHVSVSRVLQQQQRFRSCKTTLAIV